jgi:putative hydrolase of the HAD superfamily
VTPHAITLDLDDTLWPIWPAIERAEGALHAFLLERCPRTAARFPVKAMRSLRERIATQYPEHAHDFTRQRRLSLEHALRESGDDEGHAGDAFEAFYAARNQIEFYPDALAALARLAGHLPVLALTNGNADLARIGIDGHFVGCIAAREAGHAKPDAPIFHAACARLALDPAQVLHVGDDPWLDVEGARGAGLRTAWINRREEAWPAELPPPELEFSTLAALADWLGAPELPAIARRAPASLTPETP